MNHEREEGRRWRSDRKYWTSRGGWEGSSLCVTLSNNNILECICFNATPKKLLLELILLPRPNINPNPTDNTHWRESISAECLYRGGIRTYPTSSFTLLPRVAMRTLLLILYMTGRRNCWFFYEDTFWLLSCQTFQEWFWREDIPPPCAACAMITTTTTSRNNNGIDAINKGEVNKTASSSLLRARASCWCSILYIMIR